MEGFMKSVVERCIWLLKSRYRCLERHRVLYYHPTTATINISACAALHNICLSSKEPEPEPDSYPDEPGLESGPSSDGSESSSEGSTADDERPAPAHPQVSLSDRGRALRQRLVAQFQTCHSRAAREPHASHSGSPAHQGHHQRQGVCRHNGGPAHQGHCRRQGTLHRPRRGGTPAHQGHHRRQRTFRRPHLD
ncbi:uncharacterized protein LOC120842930 [Ixodes scapularis]|uniref:uncharacterized protein LOC120842930 n=1 Tax=Ixodes scapularis TaxID=6945 RepID=UPI001C39494B|nr:uncharacterized protein LOC120842930 [Ixodes scapularis]